MNFDTIKPSCIILAGGKGKRMDGVDKGLVLYKNKPLIEWVIEKIKPQVSDIIISANRNTEQYETFGYPVVTDFALSDNKQDHTYQGPLAGIGSALPASINEWVFVIACDMPLISNTIVIQLVNKIKSSNEKTISIAKINEKLQLAMLLNKYQLPSIELALKNNQLKLMLWVESNPTEAVEFLSENEFKNFNYFKDLQ